jgi:hypothetical protein
MLQIDVAYARVVCGCAARDAICIIMHNIAASPRVGIVACNNLTGCWWT